MEYRFEVLCGDIARDILYSSHLCTVIAVHSRSVYMRADDGRMLLFCPDTFGVVPFAAGFSRFDELSPLFSDKLNEEVRVSEGRVSFDDVTLTLDDINTKAEKKAVRLEVDTSDERFVKRLGCVVRYTRETGSDRGFSSVLGVLLGRCLPDESANGYALRAAALADELESSLLCGDVPLLKKALRGMIGLGYGLTPSGDDLVCGMLYAFGYLSESDRYARSCFSTLCSALDDELLSQSSEISVGYIRCAMGANRFELIENVLVALCSEQCSEARLIEQLSRLFEVGASSGSDITCGILFALSIISLLHAEEA